jgi:uncharacterized protein YdeI (YjbR/CyaY-like superfamily)
MAAKTKKKATTLRRPAQRMPAFVRRALDARGLLASYRQRPVYQRNDYLSWITGAQRDETKQKRLAQMLEELERGGVYMKMKWQPRSPAMGR